MPNHVWLIDPQIVFAYLGTKVNLHPVVQSSFYNAPVLHQIFKHIWAISINNSWSNDLTQEAINNTLKTINTALHDKKSILIYPAGWLKKQASESIIGKKSAYDIVSQIHDDTHILAVTITWLRGSSSSKAWMWETPSLLWFFTKWLFYIISNLFFFVPKRQVDIEIVDVTEEAKKKVKKWIDEFNHRLESVYNKQWPEALQYLPHYFYFNDVQTRHLPEHIEWSVDSLQHTSDYSTLQFTPDILKVITDHIHTMKPEYKAEITAQTHVILDLYFDSLDTAELKSFVQATYPDASNPPLLDLKLIGDYIVMAMGQSLHVDVLKPCRWNYPTTSAVLREVVDTFTEHDTIPWLIKQIFTRHTSRSFCYDNTFGVQTRRDYAIKAFLIADMIKKMPGEYIWIMLPALTGTSLLITAAYLAWKVPVMLNWTQWQAAFDHCAGYKDIPAILTSKKFFAKIKAPHYDKYNLVFLEDMLKSISLGQKINALAQSFTFHIPSQTKEAVILFTSWSEALPKAVSITHQNIIQNIRWALAVLDVEKDDIMLWFLPPFHSFWFTVNTILPLITWLRVAYSPDPNDAKTLANIIEHTKVTWVASTPTFMKRILWSAKPEQLQSVRFIITGAEKCPQSLFDQLHTMVPKASIIEWYGITECSPIISVNPMDAIRPGTVWVPIAGLDIEILDLDTLKPTKVWQEGMIYASGPSVFEWYIDPKIDDPFIIFKEKKYYRTWDLWYMDHDWYLTITGRLKRFIKISGEMISLPFIEWILLEKFGKKDEINLAIEAKEHSNGTATIVAFTTEEDTDLNALNACLRKSWVSNLIHINEVRKVNIIPILGSGKTDYKILKAMIV